MCKPSPLKRECPANAHRIFKTMLELHINGEIIYNLKEELDIFGRIFLDVVNPITHQNNKCICDNLYPAAANS